MVVTCLSSSKMASKTTASAQRSPLTKTRWCKIMRSQRCTRVITINKFTLNNLGTNTEWINRLNNSKRLITNWNKISSRNNRRAKATTNLMTNFSSRWTSRMRELAAAQSWALKRNWRISRFGEFPICSTWCSNLIISWARKSSNNAAPQQRNKTLMLTISMTTRFRGSPCWAAAKLTSINTDIHKVDHDF